MPGREKSAAAQIYDLSCDLPEETPFRECAERGRSYNYRIDAARNCLTALAGGADEVIGLLLMTYYCAQDAYVVLQCFKRIINLPVVPKGREIFFLDGLRKTLLLQCRSFVICAQ